MFLRVVILVFAATCCTARVIDVSDKQSAWERSGKFEGDIVLTDLQIREELTKPTFLWWNKTVPFVINDVFTDDERNTILLVIEDFNKKTPIIFKQYDPLTDRDYINITGEDSGCWSYVGRVRWGQPQQLNLQRGEFGCMTKGIIIHELLHALGFWHQHSVTDRDDFVTINWENIEEGMERNFDKYNASTITSSGVPYDYDSVMHYGPYAFSKNGLKTIETKDPNATIGQTEGFSERDLEKLAIMYRDVCDSRSAQEWFRYIYGRDIMLNVKQTRNVVNFPEHRWPNKVVPFLIDDVYTDDERNKILLAILEFFLKTSIRFKEYDPLTDKDYIHITAEVSGMCFSFTGFFGGRHFVNLDRTWCLSHGTIIHLLMQPLGFFPQHLAADRDDYVTINWENMDIGFVHHFTLRTDGIVTSFGVPYDYDSIMHFTPCTYSVNGRKTIVPKDANATIGQRDGLSEKDILKLELMYETDENSSYTTRWLFITLIIIIIIILILIIIIILIFINYSWFITRWQQLGNLGVISAFAFRPRETKKILCQGGRSQDLPGY